MVAASDQSSTSAYRLGRDLDIDEALMLARRATFDPGQFTQRVLYHHDGEVETLERWQARAVLVALAACEPDDRWSTRWPHVTEYEAAELARLGLDDQSSEQSANKPASAATNQTAERPEK